MKQRVISAIVALAIFIPVFYFGGKIFNIAFFCLTLIGLREFMNVREKEKKFPDFIRLISYLLISFLYFVNTYDAGMSFSIDYRIIAGLSLCLLLPVIISNTNIQKSEDEVVELIQKYVKYFKKEDKLFEYILSSVLYNAIIHYIIEDKNGEMNVKVYRFFYR